MLTAALEMVSYVSFFVGNNNFVNSSFNPRPFTYQYITSMQSNRIVMLCHVPYNDEIEYAYGVGMIMHLLCLISSHKCTQSWSIRDKMQVGWEPLRCRDGLFSKRQFMGNEGTRSIFVIISLGPNWSRVSILEKQQ